MIHQPSGGMQGQFTDMEISYKLIKNLRNELYDIMAVHTGKTFEDIERDSDRDNWMTATEAKEYGLVDEVLERKSPTKKP
jgi:ATP-dependent Clp protease protease subunit